MLHGATVDDDCLSRANNGCIRSTLGATQRRSPAERANVTTVNHLTAFGLEKEGSSYPQYADAAAAVGSANYRRVSFLDSPIFNL